MSESRSDQPPLTVARDKVNGEVEVKRKPWSLALIDVTVTLLMVGLVLVVMNLVAKPEALPLPESSAATDVISAAPPAPTREGEIQAPVSVPSSAAATPISLPYLDTVANVEGDDYRQRDLVLVGQGWVENIVPLQIGQRIHRGQLLMEIYSPTLIDLQLDYLKALEAQDSDAIQAARDHLTVYGQSQEQIGALSRKKPLDGLIRVRAPSDGVVAAVYVEAGMFVPMAGPMVRLVDMSSIWMEAELLSLDADGVEPGCKVEAELPRLGKSVEGVVEYVEYPGRRVGPVKVRMRFDGVNPRQAGRGYVDVRIYRAAHTPSQQDGSTKS